MSTLTTERLNIVAAKMLTFILVGEASYFLENLDDKILKIPIEVRNLITEEPSDYSPSGLTEKVRVRSFFLDVLRGKKKEYQKTMEKISVLLLAHLVLNGKDKKVLIKDLKSHASKFGAKLELLSDGDIFKEEVIEVARIVAHRAIDLVYQKD